MKVNEIMDKLQAKYGHEKEYLQAVREVLESVEEIYNRHPEFEKAKIVERLVEPDRIFTFRVTWVDDKGEVQTNTGFREQRTKAKTANFGIIYGISAFGLAQRLNIPNKEANELINGYFQLYPDVKTYMNKSIDEARENCYAQTIFGRKRSLPNITSGNAIVRGLAERNAINAPIQGSAADIIKIAMIKIANRLKRNYKRP